MGVGVGLKDSVINSHPSESLLCYSICAFLYSFLVKTTNHFVLRVSSNHFNSTDSRCRAPGCITIQLAYYSFRQSSHSSSTLLVTSSRFGAIISNTTQHLFFHSKHHVKKLIFCSYRVQIHILWICRKTVPTISGVRPKFIYFGHFFNTV